MIKVKITDEMLEGARIRQTPGGLGRWGDYQFYFNEEVEECDFWVVYDRMVEPETVNCPPQNTILITCEPPSIKPYNPAFLAQFNLIISPDAGMKAVHPNVINTQPSIPWFVGMHKKVDGKIEFTKGYDELKTMAEPVKTGLFSTITSHLAWSPSHKQRFDFIMKLKARLGDRFDLFGRGINDIEDKWEGIAPYKYYLAIESSPERDYWTEKLADAYLAGAYPIYYGCPNITDYFPAGALTIIDINKFEEAVAIIEQTISSNRYEEALPKIQEARNLVLDYYNMFPTMTRLCLPEKAALPKERLTLAPEETFWNANELARNLKIQKVYLLSNIHLQDRMLARKNQEILEYSNDLKAAVNRAEEYARSLEQELEKYRDVFARQQEYASSLEKELEKNRLEYARLTDTYRNHERESTRYVESLRQALDQLNGD